MNQNRTFASFSTSSGLTSVILAGSTTSSMGTANFSIYSATKAAVRNLARSWVLDLKGRAIRVNTLSPGATHTPGFVELAGPDKAEQQGLLDYMTTLTPIGRRVSFAPTWQRTADPVSQCCVDRNSQPNAFIARVGQMSALGTLPAGRT